MSHLWRIVDFDQTSILFEKDYLVDLLEIVDLLNVTVVIGLVDNLGAFMVLHVYLSCIGSIVLYLMLDKV